MAELRSARMKALGIIIGSLLPVAAFAQPARSQDSGRTWIADVTIISPEKLDHVEKGSVLLENGHIVRVERRPGAKKPAGALVVSGKDSFSFQGLSTLTCTLFLSLGGGLR